MFRKIATLLAVVPSLALADGFVISHQGSLLGADEQPVNDPSFKATFRVLTNLNFQENEAVPWQSGECTFKVTNGKYGILLGGGSIPGGCGEPIGADVFSATDARYLEIKVGSSVLSPRIRFGATPVAMVAGRALDADKLGGQPATAFVKADALSASGTINAGTNPVEWSKLKGVPEAFADGKDDGLAAVKVSGKFTGDGVATVIDLGVGAVNTDQLAAGAVTNEKIQGVAWGKVTDVPASLLDGDDGITTVAVSSELSGNGVSAPIGIQAVPWSKLSGTAMTVPSASAAPGGTPAAGTMYWNTTTNALQVWNGVNWQELARKPGCGEAAETAKASCEEIRTACTTTKNGAYWINPGGAGAFQTWCDFSFTGAAAGGWTLAGIISSADGIASHDCGLNWDYGDARWTDTSTLNSDAFDDSRDRKFLSWSRSAFSNVLIVETVSAAQGWKAWSVGAKTSLKDLFAVTSCTTLASSALASGGTIFNGNAVIRSNDLRSNCITDTVNNDDYSKLSGISPGNASGNAYNGGWGLGVNGDIGNCDYGSEARPATGGWSCQSYGSIGYYTGGRVWNPTCPTDEYGTFSARIYVK